VVEVLAEVGAHVDPARDFAAILGAHDLAGGAGEARGDKPGVDGRWG
jgi:hypothetical protein